MSFSQCLLRFLFVRELLECVSFAAISCFTSSRVGAVLYKVLSSINAVEIFS